LRIAAVLVLLHMNLAAMVLVSDTGDYRCCLSFITALRQTAA
jgi:hypothetical protein